MATNEIGEKIYFNEENVKVTNVRVSCNHITVPVEKVESVTVNSRTEAFVIAVSVFLLCFSPFLFFPLMPAGVRIPVAAICAVLIAASAIWVYLIFNNYVELLVSAGNRRVVMFSASMAKRDYICKIANAIGDAISDEKRFQKMKSSGEISEGSGKVNTSETMRLKLILEDYEKLKNAKMDMGKGAEDKSKGSDPKPNA